MDIVESIFMSKIGGFLVMTIVVLLFVGALRFLYGPKGVLRKSLWKGVEDEENTDTHKE